MIEIPLTQGLVALIDDEDEEQARFKWFAAASGPAIYAARNARVAERAAGAPSFIRLHRAIMQASRGQEVDHVNGDTLDCRRANLRLATRTQNMQNRGRQRNGASGFKGVSKWKANPGWIAQITILGKRVYLGSFGTPEEAARAYDAAAREAFGVFARLNFREP
jgi:hypothetical protein